MAHESYIGQHFADKNNNLYIVTSEGDIKDFRDGHPYTYPACTLTQVNGSGAGSSITVGKSQMNCLFHVVMPELGDGSIDTLKRAIEEFGKAIGLAKDGQFFADKYMPKTMLKTSSILAESFLNLGFERDDIAEHDEYLRSQTKAYLEMYTNYIISHLEMVSVLNKKK